MEMDKKTNKRVKKYNYVDGMKIKNPTTAKKLLPTASWFFFGSDGYDEYYIQDIINTKERLEEELKNPRWDLYYQASR